METESGQLEGRVAIVTGASRGLGRATAVELATAGADVALLARSATQLADAAREVAARGRHALAIPVDLADVAAPATAVARVEEELGGVDVLVNAAATDAPARVEDLDVSEWDRVLAVNLRPPFLLAKLAFRSMRRRGGGTVVNVSSVAGKRGWANAAAYCASKFALSGLTQALAAEGREHRIRACVVFPGAMATHWGVWSPVERERQSPATPPSRDALPPTHVAALIVWLAAAPPELVLNEAIVTPLHETGWP
ncbi:MAG TPA: SDR family oxidoreductase [Gaiellaceae bacterium]|jgi:NAD(P)-dependent dehydrogenase (short-subunit alcohol dehydrogenase family)|nr:SDR family oxidoreductase [Gaiellaceae bacterium]